MTTPIYQLCAVGSLSVCLSTITYKATAQISPDRTLPTQVNQSGRIFEITGGARAGTNLFHSFAEFSVPTGSQAYFNNSLQIQNIFSRVTGASVSHIDGLIRANGTASLFIINPNGIIFGLNARLDIGGSFMASTGNHFVFNDGTVFDAKDTQAKPLLTISTPLGVQYGRNQLAGISNAGNLAVPRGENLALIGGNVSSTGQLIAPGGKVQVLGDNISLSGNAKIDVSSDTGGGTVLIGGDYQGQGSVPTATKTFVGSGVTINADALTSGNGGRVIIWADETTRFYGNISARGGDNWGNGGFVEVSGLRFLDAHGNVNTLAPNGSLGMLLLDPTNITIVADAGTVTQLNQVDDINDPDLDPTTISANLINNATTNVTLQASNNITFSAPINIPTNGVGLTAEAGNNINVNASITTNRGNVSLFADADNSGGGALNIINAAINTNGGNITGIGRGSIGSGDGILLNNSNLNAGGGNISLTGRGIDNSLGNSKGIFLWNDNVVETNGTGSVNLTGIGGTGISFNRGILINRSTSVRAVNGNIEIRGTAGNGTDSDNNGVQIGGVVETTGTGNIILTGTGGNGTSFNSGILINSSSTVRAVNGSIEMSGTGGNGTGRNNIGISIRDASEVSTLNGTINLNGTGGAGTRFISGIEIETGSRLSSVNGNINLTGEGKGTEDGNYGILVGWRSIVESTRLGNVTFNGTGGTGTDTNFGIRITQASQVNSVDGNLILTGISRGTGKENQGINISAGGVVESTGIGNITITGTGVNAAGINLQSNSAISGNTINLISNGDIASSNSFIFSNTFSSSNAGDINITAKSVSLTDGTEIFANTYGTGQGGNIRINATDFVELSGTSPDGFSTLLTADTLGSGNAGNIAINTGRLIVRDGGGISSSVAPGSTGKGGNLTINASQGVELIGTSPDGKFPTRLSTATAGTGNAGDIDINTRQLVIRDGADAATITITNAAGGTLTVNASESVELIGTSTDGQLLSALSADTAGSGQAGDLNINTRKLTIQGGGAASVSTFAEGQGGRLNVNASESVEINGTTANGFASGLYAQSFAAGNAGNLTINTGELRIQNGAKVTAAAGDATDARVPTGAPVLTDYGIELPAPGAATGEAGNIAITANNTFLNNQGNIIAATDSSEGGNIQLQVKDLLLLRYNSLISASAGTAQAGGNGGNIDINTAFIVAVPKENSDITANAYIGNGGRVQVTAQGIFGTQFRPRLTPLSDITASSDFGIDGVVSINTPDVDPSRGLAKLPGNIVDASSLIAQNCPGVGGKMAQSEFIITGRGGLPPNPGESQSTDAIWTDLRLSTPETENQSNPEEAKVPNHSLTEPLVEAQGWVFNELGQVVLTAQAPIVTPHSSIMPLIQCQSQPHK